MSVTPKRNLSDQSEPWGRTVDQRLAYLERSSSKYQQDTNNALSAVNSTTTKLSEQVAAIDALTQELAAQQDILEAQQAQLTTQVAQISDLVNAQVRGQTLTNSVYATYTNSYQYYAPVTFTTPPGYSQAYVMLVCSASFDPPGTDGVVGALIPAISSPAGTQQGAQQSVTTTGGSVGSVTSSYAASVTVSAGQTISCAGYITNPSGQGWVQTSAIAIFIR